MHIEEYRYLRHLRMKVEVRARYICALVLHCVLCLQVMSSVCTKPVNFAKPYKMDMQIRVHHTKRMLFGDYKIYSQSVIFPVSIYTTIANKTRAGVIGLGMKDAKQKRKDYDQELFELKGGMDFLNASKEEYEELPNLITFEIICHSESKSIKMLLPNASSCVVSTLPTIERIISSILEVPLLWSGTMLPGSRYLTSLICQGRSPVTTWRDRCKSWTKGNVSRGIGCETDNSKRHLKSAGFIFNVQNVTSTIVKNMITPGIPLEASLSETFAVNTTFPMTNSVNGVLIDGSYSADYMFGNMQQMSEKEAASNLPIC